MRSKSGSFLLKRSGTHRGIFYDLRWCKSSLKVCFLGSDSIPCCQPM